jgi:hypothetical protein
MSKDSIKVIIVCRTPSEHRQVDPLGSLISLSCYTLHVHKINSYTIVTSANVLCRDIQVFYGSYAPTRLQCIVYLALMIPLSFGVLVSVIVWLAVGFQVGLQESELQL